MDEDDTLQMQHVLDVVAQFVWFVVSWVWLFRIRNRNSGNVVQRNLRLEGERVRDKLMKYLIASSHCRHVIRMGAPAFTRL